MDAFDVFDASPRSPRSPGSPAGCSGVALRALVVDFAAHHLPRTRTELLAMREGALGRALSGAYGALSASPPQLELVETEAAVVDEECWRRLGGSGWPNVCLREAFVLSKMMRAAVSESASDSLRHLDVAFILGGPSTALKDCILLCSGASGAPSPSTVNAESDHKSRWDSDDAAAPSLSYPAERIRNPEDPESFRCFYRGNKPCIVEGGMQGWRALTRWTDLNWLRQEHGKRIVPVEVGTLKSSGGRNRGVSTTTKGNQQLCRGTIGAGCSALDAPRDRDRSRLGDGDQTHGADWSERLMSLGAFIDAFLLPGAIGGVGYMAQHPLFEQLPSLYNDFSVPRLCDLGKLQHVNAWLGSGGTVTPLHFDSYDNLLAQVAGYKYVRLFTADQTPFLYVRHTEPRDGLGGQGNLSAVDVESPDLQAHPLFAKAAYTEAILAPGEMLFIPAKCWHYVRSLSNSISISFWF